MVIRKTIWLMVTLILFLLFFVSGYLYHLFAPGMEIRTVITPIDKETYQSLESVEYAEHPEQKNFRKLTFTFTFKYSDKMKDIKAEMSEPLKNLLTYDVYWTGESFSFDDEKRNKFIVQEDIVLYMGEVSEEDLVKLLDDGVFIVAWMEDGKEKRKEFNLGETVLFIQ